MSCSKYVALALLATARTAAADKAAADVAFAEAKRLVAEGKLAEACPKFELSNREDPQLGTLLNLADCHEQVGKLATAWAEFREAVELARQKHDDREGFARGREQKLAPRVSRLTLVKRGAPAGLAVTLDGRDVTALVGVAIPIDPGEHTITTRATGLTDANTTVTVERDGQKLEVRVPVEVATTDDVRPSGAGKTRRIIAIATGGAGVIALGVGLYFGKRGFSLYDESREHCPDNICDAKGASLVDDSRSAALKSNIFIGVGVGALAAGAILYFTAPSERRTAVTVRPTVGPGGVAGTIELRF